MRNKSVKALSRVAACFVIKANHDSARGVGHFQMVKAEALRQLANEMEAAGLPHYLAGAGSVVDIAGSGLRYPKLGSVAQDSKKLSDDFAIVGRDLRSVLDAQLAKLGS